jgi:hypothetical protein
MKTSKFICAALLLFGLVLIIFKTTNAKTTGKISANKKHHHKKAVIDYYFVFVPAGEGSYEAKGSGGSGSGTISQAYEACAPGLVIGGTASGTYSYNESTEVMTLTNVKYTPTGGTEVEYSGSVSSSNYGNSPIVLSCSK